MIPSYGQWLLALFACHGRERGKCKLKEPTVVISMLFACHHRECEKHMHRYIYIYILLNKMADGHKGQKKTTYPFQEENLRLKTFPGWFLKAIQSFSPNGPTVHRTQTNKQTE